MRSKTVAYNIITNILLQGIVIIYGFIVPKIIITNYGSNVNGLISSITQFLAYITLLESGFAPVVKSILYKPIAKMNMTEIKNILSVSEKFFKKIAKIFIVYIVFLTIIYPSIINNEFDRLYTMSLIIIISISTFSEYYFGMTYRIFLGAAQKTYIISIIQIAGYIFSTLAIIVWAKLNMSIQALKLFSGIVFILRPLVQNYYVKKRYSINLMGTAKDYKIENKWDGLIQHIAAVIHSNTDIALLTIFSKLSEVSVYSIYLMVINGVKKVVYIMTNGMEESFGDMIAKKEQKNLNVKFSIYETIYLSISTIVFSCTIVLIVPFVSIYTQNIVDANYVRYTFGILLVIAEYISIIRNPYISLAYAAGHFKETKIGALVECLSNILISIILVIRYGLVGVVIGTIIAMTIRTIEFVYHSNKYVLHRSVFRSVNKILVAIIETVVIVIISKYIPFVGNVSYLNWFFNAVIIGVLSSIVVFSTNFLLYKKDYCQLLQTVKNILKRRKK